MLVCIKYHVKASICYRVLRRLPTNVANRACEQPDLMSITKFKVATADININKLFNVFIMLCPKTAENTNKSWHRLNPTRALYVFDIYGLNLFSVGKNDSHSRPLNPFLLDNPSIVDHEKWFSSGRPHLMEIQIHFMRTYWPVALAVDVRSKASTTRSSIEA